MNPTDAKVLETALMNAVKPVYSEENGEYALWCGMEHHAQAILDAARAHLSAMQGVGVDELANFIRETDGDNSMGAGELAEKIHARLYAHRPSVEPRGDSIGQYLQGVLDECDGREINPSNYDHDDACHLNNGYVTLFQGIEEAIKQLKSPAAGQIDMPQPVQYTDGSPSREYEDHAPTPSPLAALREVVERVMREQSYSIETEPEKFGFVKGHNAALDAIIAEIDKMMGRG